MRGTRSLQRLYDRLTAKERLVAVLEAISREDHEEVERLNRSCPRHVYRITDPLYSELVETSKLIASAFAFLWLSAAKDYWISTLAGDSYVHSVSNFEQGYLQGANAAWKRAGKKGVLFGVDGREPTVDELYDIGFAAAVEKFPKRYEDLHRRLGATLKAVHEGLIRFCGDVEIEPEKILVWHPLIQEDIEQLRGLLENDQLPPHEETADAIHRTFLECWQEESQ